MFSQEFYSKVDLNRHMEKAHGIKYQPSMHRLAKVLELVPESEVKAELKEGKEKISYTKIVEKSYRERKIIQGEEVSASRFIFDFIDPLLADYN